MIRTVGLLESEAIADGAQTFSVIAGPRSTLKKLSVEKRGAKFVTDKIPDGAPYVITIQLKEEADAKATILRLNYDSALAENGKPKYLDGRPNATSSENITVPASAAGIWAEHNQHQLEITDAAPEKKYQAIDEISRAYSKLAKGLPAVSGDNRLLYSLS